MINFRQKKIHTLNEEIQIYEEAFKNTSMSINVMFTSTHTLFNELTFLLKYYKSRNNKKELKKLKQILDANTTVDWFTEKTYLGREPKYYCKFTKFDFSEETRKQIEEQYKNVTQQYKNLNGAGR